MQTESHTPWKLAHARCCGKLIITLICTYTKCLCYIIWFVIFPSTWTIFTFSWRCLECLVTVWFISWSSNGSHSLNLFMVLTIWTTFKFITAIQVTTDSQNCLTIRALRKVPVLAELHQWLAKLPSNQLNVPINYEVSSPSEKQPVVWPQLIGFTLSVVLIRRSLFFGTVVPCSGWWVHSF